MIFDAFGNLQNNDGTPINQPLNGALPDLSNEVVSPTQIKGGASSNFKTGVSGYFLDNTTGDVEFGSGKFRGDITGASGIFSGALSGGTITGGTITGGLFKTSALTNVERIIIDPSETNKRMFQIWNSSNTVRGWFGKGEESASDLAISTSASLDLSFASGLGYTRVFFVNNTGIHVDHSYTETVSLGDLGDRFGDIFGTVIHAKTQFACGSGAGSGGKDGTFKDQGGNTITVKGGIITNGI